MSLGHAANIFVVLFAIVNPVKIFTTFTPLRSEVANGDVNNPSRAQSRIFLPAHWLDLMEIEVKVFFINSLLVSTLY